MTSVLSNKNHTNYYKLCKAVIDVCSGVLRDIVHKQVQPRELERTLRGCTELRAAKLKHQQWKTISEAVAKGSYSGFDISLLYQVLRLLNNQELRNTIKRHILPSLLNASVQNCPALVSDPITKLSQDELNDLTYVESVGSYDHCTDSLLWKLYKYLSNFASQNLVHPSEQWGDNPDLGHITTGDDVERIIAIRKSIYNHISTTEVSDNDFDKYWRSLEEIMTRMNIFMANCHYRDDLDAIRSMCMDTTSEKWYHNEIQKSSLSETDLQSQIDIIKETTTRNMEQSKIELVEEIEVQAKKFKSELDSFKNENEDQKKAMEESFMHIKGDLEVVKQSTSESMTACKRDISECRSEIETIEKSSSESIVECRSDLEECRSDIQTVNQSVNESTAAIQDITTRIKQVEDVVTKMETDATDKRTRVMSALEEQTMAMILKHRDDRTFVTTKAVGKGMVILTEHGILIYSGLPGDGKTENAHELLHQYQLLHPDWMYLEYDEVIDWSDVHPNISTVILLDDCLGKTNINAGLIGGRENNNWTRLYASVKSGKVKVIMTIRKNILVKSLRQLEKYELFGDKYVVDLTSEEFRLNEQEKNDILMSYFQKFNIQASDDYTRENYKLCGLLDYKTPIQTVCKEGVEFFRKPSQMLIYEIENFMNSEYRTEKNQYCVMAYMMLMGGKMDLNGLNSNLFKHVVESLSLGSSSMNEINQALKLLNHRFVEQIRETLTYQFKHQTILESVALCFYEDNSPLLLQLCKTKFIVEFVRPRSYKVSEGEICLILKQNDYKHLIDRFMSLQHGKDSQRWFVDHPVLDDIQFVDCMLVAIESNDKYKNIVQNIIRKYNFFAFLCTSGKTYLMDKLYDSFQEYVTNVRNVLAVASYNGYTSTLLWLLDHKMDLDDIGYALSQYAPTETLTAMLSHSEVTMNHAIQALDAIASHGDSKTLEAVLNRWDDLEQEYVRSLLFSLCKYGNYKPIEIIVQIRPDVITQENRMQAFKWSCLSGNVDTVKYLVSLKLENLDWDLTNRSTNEENLSYLHAVAFYGRFDMLKYLVELGFSIRDRTTSELSVLQMAILGYRSLSIDERKLSNIIKQTSKLLSAWFEQMHDGLQLSDISQYREVLIYLMQHKDCDIKDIDINMDEHGNKLPHYFVVHNDIQLIELLRKVCSKLIYSGNDENMTCFHIAAFLGRIDLLTTLNYVGLQMTDKSTSGINVLQMAALGYCYQKMYSIEISEIIQSKSKLLAAWCKQMGRRVRLPDVFVYGKLLTYLLDCTDCDTKDLDADSDEHGNKLSHYCVVNNDIQTLELLHKANGKLIHSRNGDNMTCLHIAVFLCKFNIMKRLIDLGLCTQERTASGLSVLQMAVLGYCCNINPFLQVSDIMQSKSENLAAWYSQMEYRFNVDDVSDYMHIFTYLLQHKDCVVKELDMHVDNHGNTLSHCCVLDNNITMLELLYKANIKLIHSHNNENMTCAHTAAFTGRLDLLKRLTELGLRVSDKTLSGLTVLGMAILGYCCQDIYDNVPDNLQGKSDLMALWCKHMRPRVVLSDISQCEHVLTYLLHHKDCDIKDTEINVDGYGNKLSHYCVVYNSLSIIKLMCKVYPRALSIFNNNKHKPIHLAILLGRSEIFKVLFDSNTEQDKQYLDSLITLGKKYAGYEYLYRAFKNPELPEFLSFLPKCYPRFEIGGEEDYNTITATIHG